jgi:hypothetical protein
MPDLAFGAAFQSFSGTLLSMLQINCLVKEDTLVLKALFISHDGRIELQKFYSPLLYCYPYINYE